MTAPRPVWLSVQQVAGMLGVSKMTIYRLIESEELPAYRVGRLYRIRPMDLDRHLQAARTGKS